MPGRLTKLGRMDYSREGAMLLVNFRDEAFIVDEAVVSLWHIVDGKTLLEASRFIDAKLGHHDREVSRRTRRLVLLLKRFGLLGEGS